jgi:hypothetical protein
MLAGRSAAGEGGEWRRNPVVAVVAVALALLVLLVRSCGCSSRREELPPEVAKGLKGIYRYCPHCKKVFAVPGHEAQRVPGDEPLFVKAGKLPCPTCGKADSTETIACMHCGTHVPLPMDKKGTVPMRCPKCGKDPYGAGPPRQPGQGMGPPPPMPPRRPR